MNEELQHGPIGWNLDANGCGVGRHFDECFQDPTLAVPSMSGPSTAQHWSWNKDVGW